VIFNAITLLEALSEKYQSQKVASKKLEKGPHRDYQTVFCSPLEFMVLKKKSLKEFAFFLQVFTV
jgi:hypothetical protein